MKKTLLSSVEYSNLLQINWNEQKIQNNFRLIVNALSDHEKERQIVKDDVETLKQEVNFLKQLIKDGGSAGNVTNHNVNVTKVEGTAKDEMADPFKIREMLQKIQKQMKDLNGKQNDTDMMIDQIKDLQQKLKNDLNNSNSDKKERDSNSTSKTNLVNQQQKQRLLSANNQKEQSNSQKKQRQNKAFNKNKQNKSQTSIKDLNEGNANNSPTIKQVVQSNKHLNAQLTDLLQRLQELKNDNIRLNAQVNSHDQAIQTLRKAPAPSKLRSTEPKSNTETIKATQDKAPINQQKRNSTSNSDDQKVQSQLEDFRGDLLTLEDQINKYYLDANTLRLCYEQIKLWVGDLRKADGKKDSLILQINNKINQVNQNHKDDKQRIDQELKELRTTILNSALQQRTESKPETPSVISSTDRRALQEFDENYKDKINDKLSRLQTLLMQAATQSDLERVRAQLKQNIQQTNNKLQNVKSEVSEINKKLQQNELDQQSQNSNIKKVESDLQALSSLVTDKFGAIDKRHSITGSKIEDIKRNIQQLKQDLDFYKQNFNTKPASGNNLGGQPQKDQNGLTAFQGRRSEDFDKRKYDELRKELLNKLHDNKIELFSALKDFDRKTNNKNTFEQDIAMLFDKIGEIKLFLSKKADADDTKKSILYLEKKMSVALSSLATDDDNTQDARAAKKNWFCLSCDKVLQSYNGKVGKHIVWDGLGTNKFGTKTGGLDQNRKPKQTLPTLKK